MVGWNGDKMISIGLIMLLILLRVIKATNALSALSDLPQFNSNKCEQILITQYCPELKYNQTMVSNFAHGHHMDIDANEMVRRLCPHFCCRIISCCGDELSAPKS